MRIPFTNNNTSSPLFGSLCHEGISWTYKLYFLGVKMYLYLYVSNFFSLFLNVVREILNEI